ncbi:MAG TPA: tetratricopeptide repeat protein, partial [Anaerolineae bacterium]
MDDLVTLEAYADENRALIRNGRTDEAVAICKHILNYYPKHIESYRQMGEAYLEKENLDPAVDLFRRVLSADPENVIAYVGLATVFEKQHLLDEAAWHLERADEMEPGNFEIHKELLRMYSEAGKPRQRLKQSAAGLARLYDQEGLYSQAIQELRGITRESPSRYDARTMLAETLWHAGRIREAAEIAQGILTALPYGLKANLILGTAWKESGLADYETYLNRAEEVDPSNKIAHRLLGPRSPLNVNVISVPRYVPGALPPPLSRSFPLSPAEPVSEPLDALTVESTAPTDDLFAEPLTTEEEGGGSPSLAPETEPTLKPNLPGANLPPWLVSPSSESSEAALPSRTTATNSLSEKDTTALESEDDDLPAWLRGKGSGQQAEPPISDSSEAAAEQLPTWLDNSSGEIGAVGSEDQLQTVESTSEDQSQAVESTSAEDDVPDWLRTLQAQSAPAGEPEPAEETGATEDYVLPDFLASTTPPANAADEPAAADLLTPFAQDVEPVGEQPAQEWSGLTSQPAPTIEEYSPVDQPVEEHPEETGDTSVTPPIVVEMPA